MRVCTYNIHGGKDETKKPSLPQIAETLRETNAEVMLLQECDRFLLRSGAIHQARVLADTVGSGVHFRFYGRLRFGPLAFGNAILTRRRIVKTMQVPLRASGGEPRGALGVRLENGVTVWNTHLGLRDTWREEQLTVLADAINADRDGGAVIVGGDFNAPLNAPEVQNFLAQTGMALLSGSSPTFPASAPAHQIDFLFGLNSSPRTVGIVAGAGSDHCLLWADVEAVAPTR